MAKKIPNFKPTFNTPGEAKPVGCQPVPAAPQKLKDSNTNSTKDNSGSKKDK